MSSFQVSLEKADDPPPGLILPNGDINWNCPCLGGMAVGPCGLEFREAFSCFHYSTSEVKGSECLEQFAKLQMCMKDFPELYEEKKQDTAEEQVGEESKKEEESTKDSPTSTDTQAAKEEVVEKEVVEDTKTEAVLADTEQQAAP